ncbi:MAG: hypothetical protein DWQ10_16915 [Calditrichaeota bacterium]|nr:MAG: hypothetical protein DWQ10_16915 [Calditrichota bacterium]
MEEHAEKIKNAQINNVLGLFVLFFGIVVLIAVVFTDTTIGKQTNTVAGLILSGIGVGMFLKARKVLRKDGST